MTLTRILRRATPGRRGAQGARLEGSGESRRRRCQRRQAHEALIHRLDAELTTDTVTALDPGLATDGVLEAIGWMSGGPPGWATTTAPDGPVGRLATTDTGARWVVQVGHWSGTSTNTGNTYTDEPTLLLVPGGPLSFEITGTAGDLDAWMWTGRRSAKSSAKRHRSLRDRDPLRRAVRQARHL